MVSYNNYAQTLYNYLSSLLNIQCCVNIVRNEPENIQYPYLTYELPYGSFGDSELSTILIRTNDGKLTTCVQFVDKLEKSIGQGYKLNTGDGFIILRKGEPFAQIIDEEIGPNIKTVYINLIIEFY